MIKIVAPNTHKEEIRYLCETIFKDFLGIEYNLFFEKRGNYKISFNDKYFILENVLFKNYENYLVSESIPKEIDYIEETPIIYGKNYWEIISDNNTIEEKNCYKKIKVGINENIYCGLDIFGSIFFMLSRFEEFLISSYDQFNRVPSQNMLSIKFGFEKKAVVHEYLEILWNLILNLDSSLSKKDHKFKFIPTHDIDHLYFWKDYNFFITRLKKCLFKYKNFKQAYKEICSYFSVRIKLKKDPYDKIDYFINKSEEIGVKSIFYFLVGQHCDKDADFDLKKLKRYLEKIKERGHFIGLHPSFLSYEDINILKNDKETLENISQNKITFSRQHYLRFNVPHTFIDLESIGILNDSSFGFTDRVGFRTGCCYSYKIFDFINKKTLNLYEHPLIVMDGVIIEMNKEKAKKEIFEVMDEVKKYNGKMVILWHNSSFEVDKWEKFQELYSEIIEEVRK